MIDIDEKLLPDNITLTTVMAGVSSATVLAFSPICTVRYLVLLRVIYPLVPYSGYLNY